jgi:hypothetical protein
LDLIGAAVLWTVVREPRTEAQFKSTASLV